MRLRSTLLALLVGLAPLPAAAAPATPAASPVAATLAGTWQGALNAGMFTLHPILTFMLGKDGAWQGTLRVPEQNNVTLPLGDVLQSGGVVSFSVPAAHATYDGQLSADGQRLAGTWHQGGRDFSLAFAHTPKPFAFVRPQEPHGPYPYVAEEVRYTNPVGHVPLAGTLTHPRGAGPFPAVLLITGSGQQNRDEEILGHKPFKLIADVLTRRGIAVLRVDDRGIGGSGGDFAAATTRDFATDVEAGLAYLRSRKDIDATRVGLLGHSEGGLIAPLVAAKDPRVAFLVLLAAPGVPGAQILKRQVAMLDAAAGTPAAQAAANEALTSQVVDTVAKETDPAKLKARLEAILDAHTQPGAAPHLTPAEAQAQLRAVMSPWYQTFVRLDPRPALEHVHCPVLALDGSKDLQVDAAENLPAIAAALKAGGNRDVTTRDFPNLNHLFQHCQTGLPSEYATIAQTMAPEVLDTIADWVVAQTKAKR